MKIAVLFILLFACSTPYYNTFFYAEKSFNIGEQNYLKLKANNSLENFKSSDLQKAIEKSLKTLAEYGDSETDNSYADDAFLIIAKSSFYTNDFYNAIQATQQLIEKNPTSNLKDQALIIEGKSNIALNNIDAAIFAFSKVDISNTENFEIILEANVILAQKYLMDKNYSKANDILQQYREQDNLNELIENEIILREYLKTEFEYFFNTQNYDAILNSISSLERLSDLKNREYILEDIRLKLFNKKMFVVWEKIAIHADSLNLFSNYPQYQEFLIANMAYLDSSLNSLQEMKRINPTGYQVQIHLFWADLFSMVSLDSAIKEMTSHLNKINRINEKSFWKQKLERLGIINEFIRKKNTLFETFHNDSLKKTDTLDVFRYYYDTGIQLFEKENYSDAQEFFEKASSDSSNLELLSQSLIYRAVIYKIESDTMNFNKLLKDFIKLSSNETKKNQILQDYFNQMPNNKDNYDDLISYWNPKKMIIGNIDSIITANQWEFTEKSLENISLIKIIQSIQSNEDEAIVKQNISNFSFRYPKNPYNPYLKDYDINQLEIIRIANNADSTATLESEIPDYYAYKDSLDISVKCFVDKTGKVSDFDILDNSETKKRVRFFLLEIINYWKFNESNIEKRYFNIILKLRKDGTNKIIDEL